MNKPESSLMVLVPREPTPEMAKAGRKAVAAVADKMELAKLTAVSVIDFWQQVGHNPEGEIYRAMLAASPEQPIAEQPKSEQPDSSYSTSRVGQINKTALPRWIPVSEQMPGPGVNVLFGYRNAYGKWRTVRGHHSPLHTVDASNWEENADPDETEDGAFEPEGWWEEPVESETLNFISDEVTHWMPLPLPPGESAGEVPSDKKYLPSMPRPAASLPVSAPAGQEDARDAKRYRALRQQGGPGAKLFVRGAWSGYLGDYRHLIGEELDAAIDAMSATTKEN